MNICRKQIIIFQTTHTMALIDFKNLDNSQFHLLCNDLVKAEFSNATCLEGSGGDEGIDCFIGNNIDQIDLHVFQHKFFPNTLSNSGKRQVRESLKQVHKRPNVSKWTLLIAKNLTPGEIRWYNNKLKDLLRKHYRIYYEYFPLPVNIENKINNHFDDLKKDIVKPLIEYVHNLSIEKILSISDKELCEDSIDNHYSPLASKLQNLICFSSNIESQSVKLRNHIKDLLERYLTINDIKHRENDSDTYIMTDSVPINQFIERLWPLVETNAYSDDKFWVVLSSHPRQ
jgi:hypothetical protein